MNEKKLTFKTKAGSRRLLALFLALTLILAGIAGYVQSDKNRIMKKNVSLDVRGGILSIEQYEPRGINADSKVPAIILFHGGSESLGATSMVAWELARRGFVVLNTSMYSAGLSEQVGITEDGTREENYFRGGTQGMYDALQYVRNMPMVNQEKVGLWAHSAGSLGVAGAVTLEGDYLTLNDKLLDMLNSLFGVAITEEMIAQNADEIAAANLTAEQMAVYEHEKAKLEELQKVTVFGARFSPSAFGKKKTVAGIEVVRDPQANAMVGVGIHEDGGYLEAGSTEKYKTIFMTGDEDVKLNGWYAMPSEPNGTSTYLGQVYETTVANSPALAEAIANRSARLMFFPNTFHNGMLWDDEAVSETCEFFVQTMGYNNGYLADGSAQPVGQSTCYSYITLALTTAAICCAVAAVMALVSFLTKSEYFGSCRKECYAPVLSPKSGSFAIAAIFAMVAAGFGVYMGSSGDRSFQISNATATKWLPWEPGQVRLMTQLICTAAVGLVLFLILRLVTRKSANPVVGVKDVNIAYGWKNVGKAFFLGAIVFAALYIINAFIQIFFSTKFVFVDGSFESMHAYGFARLVKYAIILLPFTLIISCLNNMWSLKGVSDGADTAINVTVTSAGAILVFLYALIMTFSTPGHGCVLDIHCILSVPVLVPIMNYIYRKSYKLTGSVWVGAIIVALFCAWRLSSYISHQFIYYGPDPIKAFWGFY
ncbi:MAG: hypothetical protein Q4C53_07980 [Clostridia bacterium]|nr:hypothetical protein [Clostridia bacterium]